MRRGCGRFWAAFFQHNACVCYERIVGYDNETGKGDHRHYRTREEPYAITDVETLVADFLAYIRREGVTL